MKEIPEHATLACLQVAAQRDERPRHQLDEALIADEARECFGIMLQDLFSVIRLEVAIRGREEHDDGGHRFRQAKASSAVALTSARREKPPLPERFKEQAEIVYVTE